MNKKLLALTMIALALGLSVGWISLGNEFDVLHTYTINCDVEYVYLKALNVTQDARMDSNGLLAYVVVLNISNPTQENVHLENLKVELSDNATRLDQAVTLGDNLLSFHTDFSSAASDSYWNHGSSRLIALRGVYSFSDTTKALLSSHQAYFFADLLFFDQSNAPSRTIILKQLTFDSPTSTELVYNNIFGTNKSFYFLNDGINIGLTEK